MRAYPHLTLLLLAVALCCECCILTSQLVEVVPQPAELLTQVNCFIILDFQQLLTPCDPAMPGTTGSSSDSSNRANSNK
jgi:hypothetical protein